MHIVGANSFTNKGGGSSVTKTPHGTFVKSTNGTTGLTWFLVDK